MRTLFQRRRLDTTLFLAVLGLLAIGLLLVASATLGGRNADLTTRQAIWMGVGIAVMLAMLAIDYRVLLKFSFPIYALSLVPLVYLLVFGHRIAHVRSVAHACLRHRLILTYEAEAEGITKYSVLRELLKLVAVP